MSSDSSRPARRPVRGKSGQNEPDEAVETTAESVVPAPEETGGFEPVAADMTPQVEPDARAAAPLASPIAELGHVVEEEAPVQAEEESASQTNQEPLSPEINPAIPVTPMAAPVAKEEPPMPPFAAPEAETKGKKKKTPLSRFGKKSSGGETPPKKKRAYNPKKKSLIITGSVLGGIAIVIGFSLYKVGQAPSASDLVGVYQEQSGDLGFPVDRGVAAGTEFLSLYLSAPKDPNLRSAQSKMLDKALSAGATKPSWPNGVSQRILFGPVPYGLMIQESPSKASQRYIATVETTVTESQPGRDIDGNPLPDIETVTVEQVGYRLDLQKVDGSTQVFVVGNPTLIPVPELSAQDKTVEPRDVSDGPFSSELNTSLMQPFFRAWAASDEPAIAPLLAADISPEWAGGLGGQQQFESSKTFAPASVNSANAGAVDVEVKWKSPTGEIQTSNYTVEVVYQNKRWLVEDIY